jgi:fructoselysine 6-kinase
MLKVLGVGDNCIDNYVELGNQFPGGNALNFVIYASRHDGVEADYVGVVGTDENGRYMLDQIEEQGLGIQYIIVEEGTTAVTKILIRDGDRVFNDYIEGVQENAVLPYKKIPNPEDYDLIHFTVWGFGREHIPKLKETTNIILSCDFSGQLDDPRTNIMSHIDISFFSGRHLIEKGKNPELIIKNLKEKTPGIVVMTLGEHGSMVYDGVRIYRGKAIPVDVVDTLGAGDSYIASFLVSHLKGDTIPESIKKGHIAAKKICKRLGGWGGES